MNHLILQSRKLNLLCLIIFSTLFIGSSLFAQDESARATLVGNVVSVDTEPAVGVSIFIKGTRIGTKANSEGKYRLAMIPVGAQTVVITGVGYAKKEIAMSFEAGETKQLDINLEIEAVRAQDIVVIGASRRPQKITDAPASVAAITPIELERATAHGQLGKVLENQVGIDVAQSGANDFNINTRGFNNSINRRVLVLIDGRDPSTPLLNLQEWNSLTSALSDVKQLEVVRGPGSALFGLNAYNGVINITTNAPRDVLGTRASLTYGEFETYRGDFRHAGALGDFSYKIAGGFSRMRNVTLNSRDTTRGGFLEYARLGIDRQPLQDDWLNNFSNFVTLRGDYDFSTESHLTFEAGFTNSGNEVYVNTIGRILIPEVNKPFIRAAYNSEKWNTQVVWNRRFTPIPQAVLNTPAANSAEDSDDITTEVQFNDSFFDDHLKVISGISHQWQRINTIVSGADPLLSRNNLHHNFTGIYTQLEYKLLDNLELVGAARIDRSTLFNTFFSPKGALVWSLVEGHTLRFTVNRSFLRPSYPDLYRRSFLGQNINLGTTVSAINDSLRRFTGNPLLPDTLTIAGTRGIANELQRFSLGNPNIQPEEAWSFEVGYKAVLTKSLFITADVYLNRRSNFISSPLSANAPLVFTPFSPNLGGVASAYNEFVSQQLLTALQSRNVNPAEFILNEGVPTLAQSTINVGLIQEVGAELSANYYFSEELLLSANYAYIDAKVLENANPLQPILPNTSRHRVNLSASFTKQGEFDVALAFRYVEGFPWLAGVQEGFVPTFAVLNLQGSYTILPGLKALVSVQNLLDRRHYQIFGGTLQRRYSTVSLSYQF
ncbi:MAG: TonB-dependent receptor [Chloroherpetonaceae bacterium]|nr:TonB-dependent receptor [Chloroherpetonaceae bacterium]